MRAREVAPFPLILWLSRFKPSGKIQVPSPDFKQGSQSATEVAATFELFFSLESGKVVRRKNIMESCRSVSLLTYSIILHLELKVLLISVRRTKKLLSYFPTIPPAYHHHHHTTASASLSSAFQRCF